MILKMILKPVLLVVILLLLTQSLLITVPTLAGLSPVERIYIQGFVLCFLAAVSIFLIIRSQIRIVRYIYVAPLMFAVVMAATLVSHLDKKDLPISGETIIQDFDVNNHQETLFANGRIRAKRSFYNENIIWDEYRIADVGVMRVNYMDGNNPSGKKQNMKIDLPLAGGSEKPVTACDIDLKDDESVGEVILFGGGNEEYRLYYKDKDLGWPDSYDPTLGLTEKAHAACKEMIEVYLEYGKQSF